MLGFVSFNSLFDAAAIQTYQAARPSSCCGMLRTFSGCTERPDTERYAGWREDSCHGSHAQPSRRVPTVRGPRTPREHPWTEEHHGYAD
jgi:hypothetical protein